MVNILNQHIWLPLLLLTVTAFFMGVYGFKKQSFENPFTDKNLLNKGLNMPTIWLYYDDSEVNSRLWGDFGARSTHVINLPFLNLCYKSIVEKNKGKFKVEVISGLAGLATLLGGWDEMPKELQNHLASVKTSELNWIRAKVLSKFGGLWVHPATICFNAFPDIPYEKVVFYGTDQDESYNGGNSLPSMYVMGAGKPEHPVFVKWEKAAYERLNNLGGGGDIRGDAKWDYIAFATNNVELYPSLELSRKSNGKRIEIDDLLSIEPIVPKNELYLPIPWPELKNRRKTEWFLRMSEEQIQEADFTLAKLLIK